MSKLPIIYVAADDSKDWVTFAVQPAASDTCTMGQTVSNEPRKLRRFLDRVARHGTLRVCYEAGSAGFALHRWITSWGYPCDVAAPSLTPRRPGDRRKTDRQFDIGDRVEAARLLGVRETPSLMVPSLGQQPAGATGTVIGGPADRDTLIWWRIDWDLGPDGWVTETVLRSA
jgi:hypothetical protein